MAVDTERDAAMRQKITVVKSRPLILTAAEVRAVLNGTKTQHRVRIKPQPVQVERYLHGGPTDSIDAASAVMRGPDGKGWACCGPFRCPLGVPGDRLWVRETFGFNHYDDGNTRAWKRTLYRADGLEEPSDNGSPAPWRSPLAMPRRLSRLTLEVESVRVQRVQDISEEDAWADGVDEFPISIQDQHGHIKPVVYHRLAESCRDAFQRKYISRYGIDWRANDWVFALTFKRAEVAR